MQENKMTAYINAIILSKDILAMSRGKKITLRKDNLKKNAKKKAQASRTQNKNSKETKFDKGIKHIQN